MKKESIEGGEMTPVQWKVGSQYKQDDIWLVDIKDSSDSIIARTMHVYPTIAKVNAKLIAAAPDLLEALQFYVSICGNTCYSITRESAKAMYDKGQAALAKTTQ